jgi:hypothetical protein
VDGGRESFLGGFRQFVSSPAEGNFHKKLMFFLAVFTQAINASSRIFKRINTILKKELLQRFKGGTVLLAFFQFNQKYAHFLPVS